MRFLIGELSAIAVLILCGTLALWLRLADPFLALLMNLATFAAAAAVALIPVIFFGSAPVLPRR